LAVFSIESFALVLAHTIIRAVSPPPRPPALEA
jgi:hypothetical protein